MDLIKPVQSISSNLLDVKNPIELLNGHETKEPDDIVKIEYDVNKYMIHKIVDGVIELKKIKWGESMNIPENVKKYASYNMHLESDMLLEIIKKRRLNMAYRMTDEEKWIVQNKESFVKYFNNKKGDSKWEN